MKFEIEKKAVLVASRNIGDIFTEDFLGVYFYKYIKRTGDIITVQNIETKTIYNVPDYYKMYPVVKPIKKTKKIGAQSV